MLGTAAGIAVTVALLADLGAFIQSSGASMTARAVASISADWQVELVPGTTEATVVAAAKDAAAVRTIESVGYADVSGIEFNTGDTVQATGDGKAIGLNSSYSTTFPQGFRMLAGDSSGAVLLQQTAANLHAAPGEIVIIHRPGLPDATVTISGVLDLKTADTFFRAMGVPAGAAPQAPPDNAIFMPLADWHRLFDPQAQARPDSVRLQLHVALDHAALPPDPNAAFAAATEAGHNFEARVAGSAILGNNLAAQLDAARGDSLFARVLFLFLGAPGVVLAALLTFAVASSGADRRRRDQALLRLRGASPFMLLRFAIIEAAGVGVVGAATGMMLAAALLPAIRLNLFGPQVALWFGVAGLAGLLLAAAAIVVPAWHGSRTTSVAASRQTVESRPAPLWQRTYLDGICLALAGIVFWKTAASGYQIVLATEGVTSVSVDYAAFLAPLLLWVGAGLLTVRLGRLFLGHGRRVIEPLAAGLAGEVAPAVASSLSRQRHRVAAGIAFAALAIAFATSTALFNTTYQAQSRVDAELTNGADVTVTGSTSAAPGSILDKLKAIPGVVNAQAMQHRYAYVGTDLQDLYGIDPNTIGQATTMSDAFFQNGQAKATLAELAWTPAGVLVSDETVNDFQLKQGDTLNLRLQDVNGTYKVI
ncbi:MAG: FtsX-like permease family protein, partial [Devosia sp.]